jgi:hypothetical protein
MAKIKLTEKNKVEILLDVLDRVLKLEKRVKELEDKPVTPPAKPA